MMSRLRPVVFLPLVMALVAGACSSSSRSTPAGRWDAVVYPNGLEVPFAFDVAQDGGKLSATFFDGDVKVPSSDGKVEGDKLTLKFPQYGTTLTATLKGDTLDGFYDRGTRGKGYPFKAVRHVAPPAETAAVPSIDGTWWIPVENARGEKAWKFVVRQRDADVNGAIMRVDGDTGTLTGRYHDGTFVLSHFSGARPTRLEVTVAADGTLQLLEDGKNHRTAIRETEAIAKGLPAPTDPTQHLRMRNPEERLQFSFPDLTGKIVTNDDPRFQNKVLIVSVTGSWCPNCHDEAPFLADLYRSHHDKGLEIVGLAFEEAAQLPNPERLRAFIEQFHLPYLFLVAGEPDKAAELIPQAVNLNTFPATFVLGRDGRVAATHSGYASKATGAAYMQEQQAFVAEIDKLLAE